VNKGYEVTFFYSDERDEELVADEVSVRPELLDGFVKTVQDIEKGDRRFTTYIRIPEGVERVQIVSPKRGPAVSTEGF
jgi:hypothetical protein